MKQAAQEQHASISKAKQMMYNQIYGHGSTVTSIQEMNSSMEQTKGSHASFNTRGSGTVRKDQFESSLKSISIPVQIPNDKYRGACYDPNPQPMSNPYDLYQPASFVPQFNNGGSAASSQFEVNDRSMQSHQLRINGKNGNTGSS